MLIDYKKVFHNCLDKQDFKKAYKLAYWGEKEKSSLSSISSVDYFPVYSFWIEYWKLYWKLWGVDYGSN